jgi:hydrogenase maturation protease
MAAPATTGSSGRRVVLGVGARSRHDDGVGPQVVGELDGRVPPEVELVEGVADPTELLDLWDGAELAIVVDAMVSGAPVGSVLRLEGPELGRATTGHATSSHGLSVRDAYELGRSLGRLPGRLLVYLVEAGDLAPGVGLSPAAARAADRVARSVEAELRRPRSPPIPTY